MKKLAIMILTVILMLTNLVFASTDVEVQMYLLDLNAISVDSQKIEGTFTVQNIENKIPTASFYRIEVYYGDTFDTWELISMGEKVEFSIGAKETKTISYTYEFPEAIPTGEYHLVARLITRTGMPITVNTMDLGRIEGTDRFLETVTGYTMIKDISGEEVLPESGPTFGQTDNIEGVVKLRNKSKQDINAYAEIVVYAREIGFKEAEEKIVKTDVATFKANKETSYTIKLPNMETPESYLAIVTMKDENGQKISGELKYRYVIAGISGKILDITGTYNEEIEDAEIQVQVSGPADGSILENSKLVFTVYNKDTNQEIKKVEEVIDLGGETRIVAVPMGLNNLAVENMEVEAKLMFGLTALDSNKVEIHAENIKNLKPEEKATDVKGTEYEESVEYLVDMGIINGYPDGTFKPNSNITRAEYTTIIMKYLGEEPGEVELETRHFADVESTHWARGYINKAYDNKVVSGYTDGTFKPNGNITYQEAITILLNASGYQEVGKTGTWPHNYIEKANEIGLTSVILGEDLGSAATRGNIALLTYKMIIIGME